MYKLIAIDLDGTLLNDDKKIPKENLELINDLIRSGYEIVIATGRRYWSAKELTIGIDSHMTILANNGNVVRNSEDDKIIISKYLNKDDFLTIFEEGKTRDLHPIIHVDFYDEGYDLIVELDDNDKDIRNYLPEGETRYKKYEKDMDLEWDKILVLVYPGKKDELNSFHNYIKEKYPGKYNTHVMENIQMAEAMLEIMNPLGTKWNALEEYAKSKGISNSEIITIGDDNNDIEMIKNAGLGIAMSNGSSLVKESAKIITKKDNNNAGVAFELKRVLGI